MAEPSAAVNGSIVSQPPRRKLIIDTDSGGDDAVAVMCAFSQLDVEVVALTTCWGNVSVDQAVENVGKLLDFYGLDIPLYRGAEGPLVGDRETTAWGGYGTDGYGDADFPRPLHRVTTDEPACVALARMLGGIRPHEETGEIWQLAVLGPCTNLALALKMNGSCCDNLGGGGYPGLVLMGGAIEAKGNSNMAAEFNFHCDPEAAHIVLHNAAPASRVTLVSWELCVSCPMTWPWFDAWLARPQHSRSAGELANPARSRCHLFLEKLFAKLEAFTRTDESHVADTGDDPSTQDETCVIPDAVAMAALLDPSFSLQTFDTYVTVELWGRETRGMTVLDWYGTDASMKARGRRRNCCVITKADVSAFLRLMDSITHCHLVSDMPMTDSPRGTHALFEPGRRRSLVCQQALAAAAAEAESEEDDEAPAADQQKAALSPAPPAKPPGGGSAAILRRSSKEAPTA
eukprot:TRINITY_DN16345_c0_g1_i1.p1 TRINITY_DN16345_c0_g1~~TRINITY_DN16345_c0_g1_i1.p1  ORF type:complete len:459 (+),score=115.26 TRINITY_DN16345_c0_g1_i1:81-1457(+)